jgi:hypothetical protein
MTTKEFGEMRSVFQKMLSKMTQERLICEENMILQGIDALQSNLNKQQTLLSDVRRMIAYHNDFTPDRIIERSKL